MGKVELWIPGVAVCVIRRLTGLENMGASGPAMGTSRKSGRAGKRLEEGETWHRKLEMCLSL